MTQPGLVVVGAGDHARVVIEAVLAGGRSVQGLVAPEPPGSVLMGVPVLGGDDCLPRLRAEGIAALVLGVGSNRLRASLLELALALGFELPAILHPAAFASPSCVLEAGAVVLQRAAVGTGAMIGAGAIVNSGAVVEHDCAIGTAAHVAPGCALAGRVQVGARSLVGVGSAVRPLVSIGRDAVIGAGSAVVCDVPDGAVWGGCPARPLANGRRAVPSA